ncbi:hypothetical protein COCOBI_01-4560 [Coccomyxa sp. Obi]|nr:hypothetical protein COCOBI_01-4560 [Coccomyxa sp. Obi]
MIKLQYFSSFISLLVVGIASGQTGMVDEFGDLIPESLIPAPSPPAVVKISEVVKEQTFEHHVAPFLRSSPPPMAPAPGPAAGAPAPGLLSAYDMEPPEQRKVVGVAHVAMPAAGPTLLPSNLTVAGESVTQTGLPEVAIESMPSDAPLSISPDDNATLKAVQTFAPPAPVAFVSADGSLIFVGPASPSGYVSASAGPAHWLWPTIALVGFIGIVGSIVWAYSKNRQR